MVQQQHKAALQLGLYMVLCQDGAALPQAWGMGTPRGTRQCLPPVHPMGLLSYTTAMHQQ